MNISIVFSGLVPNHSSLEQSKPYQIAKSLGANVTENFDEKTTHLVAACTGTNKVNSARKLNKVKVVQPDWLWTCAERWEHVEERLFPLSSSKNSRMRQPPPHCHSPGKYFNIYLSHAFLRWFYVYLRTQRTIPGTKVHRHNKSPPELLKRRH